MSVDILCKQCQAAHTSVLIGHFPNEPGLSSLPPGFLLPAHHFFIHHRTVEGEDANNVSVEEFTV